MADSVDDATLTFDGVYGIYRDFHGDTAAIQGPLLRGSLSDLRLPVVAPGLSSVLASDFGRYFVEGGVGDVLYAQRVIRLTNQTTGDEWEAIRQFAVNNQLGVPQAVATGHESTEVLFLGNDYDSTLWRDIQGAYPDVSLRVAWVHGVIFRERDQGRVYYVAWMSRCRTIYAGPLGPNTGRLPVYHHSPGFWGSEEANWFAAQALNPLLSQAYQVYGSGGIEPGFSHPVGLTLTREA